MFDDCNYLGVIVIDSRFHNILISYMDMEEFLLEWSRRFSSIPKIINLISISDDTFDQLEELQETESLIFKGDN
jgi:hypothetical protein